MEILDKGKSVACKWKDKAKSYILWKKSKTLPSWMFLLASLLFLVSALWIHNYYASFYYAVEVDGEFLGLVSEKEEIEEYLKEQKQEKEKYHQMELFYQEEVTFSWEYRPWERESPQQVKESLANLNYYTEGWELLVDGEGVALLENSENYQQIIEQLKEHFMADSQEEKITGVEIVEDLNYQETTALPNDIISVEEAVDYLLGKGNDRLTIASRGQDRGGADYEMGDPLVTVKVTKEVKEEKTIDYQVEEKEDSSLPKGENEIKEEGEEGLKEITYKITTKNEEEVKREKIDQEILKKPKNEVKLIGTRTASISSRGSAPPSSGPFQWPVEGGGTITQRYHAAHRAIDIASNRGTPILAAQGGTVDRVERHSGAAGNYIQIRHNINGTTYYTRYLHNDKNLVRVGETVGKGEMIAYMGDTGRATGVHLHFEIHRGSVNNRVNPLDYFQ